MTSHESISCNIQHMASGSSTLSYCYCQKNCFLGHGSFGDVIRGIWKYSDERTAKVAIKVIQKPDEVKYEIDILKLVSHPNVLKYFAQMDIAATNTKFIVTELCDGTLLKLVANSYYLAFDERLVLHEIAKGVAHLHEKRILHRDLKPGNILYSLKTPENTKHCVTMKVADFGGSRIVQEDKNHKTRTRTQDGDYSWKFRAFGTAGWIAPEFLNGEPNYTPRGDIFPLGLIFAFMLCEGRHPYGDDAESRDECIKNKKPMLWTSASSLKDRKDGSYELISQMLATMPEGRLSAKEILQHEFFSFDHNEAMIAQQPSISSQNPSSIEHIREVILQHDFISLDNEAVIKQQSTISKQNPPSIEHIRQKGKELRKLCELKELDAATFSRFNELVGDKEAVTNSLTSLGSNTPLMLLCICNQSDSLDKCVEIFLQQPYIDVNQANETGETVLMTLCRCSESDQIMQVVNLLIEKDPELLFRTDKHGSNALMHLCKNSQSDYIVEIAELLISKGASVNYVDKDGFTALMFLCRFSKSNKIVQMVELLVEKGAKLNLKDGGSMTALMWLCWASRNDHIVKVAEILVKKDVDWRQTGGEGLNVLMYLCKKSESDKIVELGKLFINGVGQEGIGVNRLDIHGFNALMWLCWFSENEKIVEMAELLIAEKIDMTQKNADGRDAAFFVTDNQHLTPETKRKLNSLISPNRCSLM